MRCDKSMHQHFCILCFEFFFYRANMKITNKILVNDIVVYLQINLQGVLSRCKRFIFFC